MSELSQISETIPANLLEEEDITTLLILDAEGSDVIEEIPIHLNNPFTSDLSALAPQAEIATLPRFFTLSSQLIDKIQDQEGIVSSQRVQLIEEYPFERIDRYGDEVIVWRLISRRPANLSNEGTRQQKTFRVQYQIRSPKYPNHMIYFENRPLDHIIEFSCWSKSAKLANARALWLESTMVNHTWLFQSQGFDRFYFEERLSDNYLNAGGQNLFQRGLRFMVRMNEYKTKLEPIIRNITLQSQLKDYLATSRTTS